MLRILATIMLAALATTTSASSLKRLPIEQFTALLEYGRTLYVIDPAGVEIAYRYNRNGTYVMRDIDGCMAGRWRLDSNALYEQVSTISFDGLVFDIDQLSNRSDEIGTIVRALQAAGNVGVGLYHDGDYFVLMPQRNDIVPREFLAVVIDRQDNQQLSCP